MKCAKVDDFIVRELKSLGRRREIRVREFRKYELLCARCNYRTITYTSVVAEVPLLRGVGVRCYSQGLISQKTRSFQDDKMIGK